MKEKPMNNNANSSLEPPNPVIGYVVGGGLQANLQVRLIVPADQVQEGSFVVIDSGNWRFYGLVTDLFLGSTDPRFADEQSENRLPAKLAELLHGQTLFTNLSVMSVLMLERGPEPGSPGYGAWRRENPDDKSPIPVKTVPRHHAEARLADGMDIAQIFGSEGEGHNFRIGNTREQGHPVCIDLDKFVQRSSGIFGATGTGKSFLTRVILAGLIHADNASTLIFDMHNEYGPDDTSSDTGEAVPGLRGKFPNKVRMVGLGAKTSIRGVNPDFTLEIAESDITPADILMLTQELNLRETTPATLSALEGTFHKNWFHAFKNMRVGTTVEDENGKQVPAPDSVAFWAFHAGVNTSAAEALHSKLGDMFKRPYIVESPAANTLGEIVKHLNEKHHIILSFGNFESDLDYLLVTNLITRHIRETWEKKTNAFRTDHEKNPEPRPLVVVVEEAHKLLSREMASQTTFSTIAREMRKYYVTLLIIDQRPSQIYDEVMSQLGTRISGWLGDEDDINAVLSGLAGRSVLRGMLAHLQPKEEVLMLGWGISMPLPLRSRRYDQQFWNELLKDTGRPVTGGRQERDDLNAEMGY
jgi:hypothetical protein